MFRNALQKRLSECPADEVPTIKGLVSTIESYPLRSAYDDETKVALLKGLPQEVIERMRQAYAQAAQNGQQS